MPRAKQRTPERRDRLLEVAIATLSAYAPGPPTRGHRTATGPRMASARGNPPVRAAAAEAYTAEEVEAEAQHHAGRHATGRSCWRQCTLAGLRRYCRPNQHRSPMPLAGQPS